MVGCSPSRAPRFARCALLLCIAVFALSTIARAQTSAVVFYADRGVSDSFWSPLFAAIHEDLADEDFGAAGHSFDHHPRLMRGSEILPGEEFDHVIVVKLQGRCDVVQQAYRPLQPGPLGWVLRVHGKIQPYIYVDCTRLAQTLDPTTLGMSRDARTCAMSQAIAHVLVHEWIHIATQNPGHTAHGITEAQLTPSTLIAEPNVTRESAPKQPSAAPDTAPGDE